MKKKEYISPVANTYNVPATEMLAGSEQTVQSGGSNKDKNITTAEGKGGFFDDDDLD